MRRVLVATFGLALLAATALAVLGVVPDVVAAHGNHVEVDDQVSANGTVVVESAFALDDGFVVLHADDGGEPGEPLAHRPLDGADFRTGLTVSLDPTTWREIDGHRTVWAVLHADRGDASFDPETDEPLQYFGQLAGERFTLARGDAPTYVLADRFSPQSVTAGRVTVPKVALGSAGHLVLRNETRDGPGAVVGTAALDAGVHTAVTVALNETYLARQPDPFFLVAQVYRDDGDGSFDAGDDPVTAGDAVVGSGFVVRNPASDDGNGSAGGSTTTADGGDRTTDDGPVVNTPTTETGPVVNTPTDGGTTATTDGSDESTATTGDSASPGQSGFGPLVAILVAVAVGLLGARRR